jgi:hypothetical protein
MKTENMKSPKGNAVPNQIIITEDGRGWNGNFIDKKTFQSYGKTIAEVITWPDSTYVTLDSHYWNYSVATSKYRNIFLGESTKETEKRIASGEYTLEDLNK